MPLRSQRRRGELGRLPTPGISAQLGRLLRPLASPLEEPTGSLCSLILPDWQSPEVSRTAAAIRCPYRPPFLTVSRFPPPSGSVTEMRFHGE